jgi:hypothetical protein
LWSELGNLYGHEDLTRKANVCYSIGTKQWGKNSSETKFFKIIITKSELEQGFSALKHLKVYMRNSISAE